MLSMSNVEVKYFGIILILRGVSLEVKEGQIVALLGANGAGKSTTLKAISGLLKPEEGRVTAGAVQFNGNRIENGDPETIARMGIIQVMEGRRVLEHLTVEENVVGGALIRRNRGDLKADLEMVYSYFPMLRALRRQVSGYISGGEQQMMVIGRALMARPKLMLLDEPSLGLAPKLVAEIFDIVGRINQEQKTSIVLVEQNARAALNLAQHGYVMENGRIVLEGSAEKLRDNPDVKEFYLGLTELGKKRSYHDVKHYKRRKRWLG